MEAHFPGSSKVERKFSIDLIELACALTLDNDEVTVSLLGQRHNSAAVGHRRNMLASTRRRFRHRKGTALQNRYTVAQTRKPYAMRGK
jgi:hypothetical protein